MHIARSNCGTAEVLLANQLVKEMIMLENRLRATRYSGLKYTKRTTGTVAVVFHVTSDPFYCLSILSHAGEQPVTWA